MIRWANKLYCDKIIQKRKRKVIKAIDAGKIRPGIYCIMLSTNPENLFDIINVNEFKFPYYQKIDLYILGLAVGYGHALELVTNMIDEVYQNTGDIKVREYYQDRWELC